MIGMQYKIPLPQDFDMEKIVARVRNNGHKTDGFDGLLFKCYLIKEKGVHSFENMYSPLYIWKDSEGMNKFLFDGYYDNIIGSFGWQQVNIGIPLFTELSQDFSESKYMLEETNEIAPALSLTGLTDRIIHSNAEDASYVGRVCIYNPDKWKYSIFYFYKNCPAVSTEIYRILHISQ